MKAAIAVDDWKLPVFRRRLDEAGFAYKDVGAIVGATTMLTVETDNIDRLAKVLRESQAECDKARR